MTLQKDKVCRVYVLSYSLIDDPSDLAFIRMCFLLADLETNTSVYGYLSAIIDWKY